jgi:hypothetical protein
MNEQLALIEPCPICLRITASPDARQPDIDPWGAGAHRHCLTAAARWYPNAYAEGVAAREARPAAAREVAEPREAASVVVPFARTAAL